MSKTNEWDLLKHQFEALVQDESVDPDSIEKVLDDQVRRRFAELINRTAAPFVFSHMRVPRVSSGHFLKVEDGST